MGGRERERGRGRGREGEGGRGREGGEREYCHIEVSLETSIIQVYIVSGTHIICREVNTLGAWIVVPP